MSLVRNSYAMAVAVFLLAGCGTDAEELSGAKARVVAEADPICVETREKVGDLGSDPAAERDAVQSAADRLKAIDIPGEDQTQYKVFQTHVQNMALSLEDLSQSRQVASPSQERAQTALDRARQSHDLAKQAAASYGFIECSQGLAQ
ncbi:MAG: hypothetical protein M3O23_03490 [Actinomycetota bacterium]|nr:hypothetical protein [Actinomycetota bacterium]